MKAGNNHRLKGRSLSLTLVVLVITTIALWAWEKNPFANTLLLAQEWYIAPSSEFHVDARNDSVVSMKPTEKIVVNISDSIITKAEENFSTAPVDSISTLSPETIDRNEDMTSSSETEEFHVDARNDSVASMKPTEKIVVNISDSIITKAEENFSTAPVDSISTLSPETIDRNEDMTSSSETKVCNYAKGRWVGDSLRPLYSGLGCKKWLSAMWACRLTQRKDFSYEGYRWQPESCEMPEFERYAFLRRMQDKTIAFIGDSLGRQQFQSLMCMATGGEESPEVQNVGKKYGLVKARGAIRPDGWAYWFPKTNTTILYYWSASLSDLVPLNTSDRNTNVAMHLDRPPAFMRRFIHCFDVLILNTGHHWNRGKLNANRWVMYVDGKPNEDKKRGEIGNAKNFTVHSIVRWLDSHLPSYPHLKVFFRTISPRHFFNGDWNTGGTCDNTTPLSGGSEVMQDGSSDPVIEGAVKGTKVKILDITSISKLRDEGHISRYSIRGTTDVNDCLHWCLPGIPDTWNELLVAQI